jgi:hypothetical protein
MARIEIVNLSFALAGSTMLLKLEIMLRFSVEVFPCQGKQRFGQPSFHRIDDKLGDPYVKPEGLEN